MIRRTDTLYTLPRSVLLLLAIFVWLSIIAIFVPRRVVLTRSRLNVWPRKAVHMVIIGRKLFTVTFIVEATVRRLVTLMLKICLGNRRPTGVSFAGLSTVVATVMMLGWVVVMSYTLLENIEAYAVVDPVADSLAVGLTILMLRKWLVLLRLVGGQLCFPRARIRMSMGFGQFPVWCNVRLMVLWLRFGTGFKHPSLRLLNTFRGVITLPMFPPKLRSALKVGCLIIGAWLRMCCFYLRNSLHFLAACRAVRRPVRFLTAGLQSCLPLPIMMITGWLDLVTPPSVL